MHRRFKQFFDRVLEKSEIQFEIILGDDCLDESLLQKGPLSLFTLWWCVDVGAWLATAVVVFETVSPISAFSLPV